MARREERGKRRREEKEVKERMGHHQLLGRAQ
jgi:hypothetical protein